MVVESTTNPDLNNLASNSQKKSETHCMVPITVQLKDIFGPNEIGEITICDTTGFWDTMDPEVDVANATAVIEAFQKCKSVKILALSSYPSLGDKGRSIQKLAHMLISMLPGIEDRLDAIFYVFTKYPATTNIPNLLKNIKTLQVDKDSSLRWDTAFIKILSDMMEKTMNGAYKLDPIHGDPKILIRELQRLRGISNPGEIFRYPMREETQRTEYLEKDRDNALEYIEKLIIQMEILRTMPEVESKTAGTYFRTVEKIRGYVQELQKTAELFLISIDNQTGTISFMYFARSLSRLKNAQWINRIDPGMYDTLMQRITEDLMRYVQQLEDRLIKLDLTLKHHDNISIAQEILVKIESMTVLECTIPQLET
ncbi:unnamed protein product, partial [Rotaria sp. Silwood1]